MEATKNPQMYLGAKKPVGVFGTIIHEVTNICACACKMTHKTSIGPLMMRNYL
jgi:hypothetical protein